MKKSRIGFYLFLFLAPLEIFSQLNVTPNGTATTLAQTIVGTGVSVSNATLNCGANGAGIFTYSGSTLGVTNGIILTSGHASDATMSAQIISQSTGNIFNDPDLATVTSGNQNDVCYLAFDFVPLCNQISVTYEFGSSEYQGFQCSNYNDGFGLFLSGPDPAGGNYSSVNIATLSSGTPVSINNINNGQSPCTSASNPAYYIDNTSGTDVVYEGLTTAITSVKPVVACSTYHMKLAICDISDELYDSGVFIQGNSINCTNAPTVTASSTPANCGSSNGSATASVTNYTGTITYQWLPGGQTTSTLNNLTSGTYSCVVTYTSACSSNATQTVTATVGNTGAVITVTATPQNATCVTSTNGSISISISGGTVPYTAVWNTSPVQTGTTAANLAPGVYQVTVTDNSGCLQTNTFNVGATYPTLLQVSSAQICGNQGVLTAPSGSNYQWYDNSGTIITGANSQTYSATGVTGGQHYITTYTDPTTGCKDSTQINITQINIGFNPITSAPCNGGNNGSLGFTPSSGNNFTSFDWNMTGAGTGGATSVGTPIDINSLAGGSYTVVITQAGNPSCSYTYTVNLVAGVIPPPTIDTLKVCNGDTVRLNPNVAGSSSNWYTSIGVSLGSTTPLLLYPAPYTGLNISKNHALYIDSLQNAAGCKSVYKAVIKFMSFNASISIQLKPKCHNDATGKIQAGVIRENFGPINKPYSFTWIYPSPYVSPGVVTANPPVPVYSTESNLGAGFYQCIIKAGNCIDTVSATLVNPPVFPGDTMHAYFCPKDSLALVVAPAGYATYHWLNDHVPVTSVENPNYANDSIYVLTADLSNYFVYYTKSGCPDSAKLRVDFPVYNAFRPDVTVNIFTPNGDNRNDFFYPFYQINVSQYSIAKQVESYSLSIFNRWGKLIFETTDYNKGWDGKEANGNPADDGSYFYITKYKSNCATKADIIQKKGFVQLLR